MSENPGSEWGVLWCRPGLAAAQGAQPSGPHWSIHTGPDLSRLVHTRPDWSTLVQTGPAGLDWSRLWTVYRLGLFRETDTRFLQLNPVSSLFCSSRTLYKLEPLEGFPLVHSWLNILVLSIIYEEQDHSSQQIIHYSISTYCLCIICYIELAEVALFLCLPFVVLGCTNNRPPAPTEHWFNVQKEGIHRSNGMLLICRNAKLSLTWSSQGLV